MGHSPRGHKESNATELLNIFFSHFTPCGRWSQDLKWTLTTEHIPKKASRLTKTPLQSVWGQPLLPSGLFLVPVSRAVRPLGAKSRPSQPTHPPPLLATHSWVSVHASLPALAVSGSWHAQPGTARYPSSPCPPFLPSLHPVAARPCPRVRPCRAGAGGGLGGHAAFRRHLSSPLTRHEITVSLLMGATAVAAEPSVPVGSGPPGGQKGPRPGASHFLPQARGHAGAPK